MALTQISTQGIKDGTISSADLADQSVTLAKLPHGTSSNDGKFLRANNGADPTFETVSSIGGGTGVDFDDNVKARFGTGNDLEIYHSSSVNYIQTHNNSNLEIKHGSDVGIKSIADGAVEIYHDGSKKFHTFSEGVTLFGDVFFDNPINAGKDLEWDASQDRLEFKDDVSAVFGASADLQIYHSSNESRIQNTSDKPLKIINGGNAGMLIQNQNSFDLEIKTNAEDAIKCIANAGVELYYDNSKKFETTSSGVTLRGTIHRFEGTLRPNDATGSDIGTSDDRIRDIYVYNDIDIKDNGKLLLGDSNDLEIYHDGSSSYIKDNSNQLYIRANAAIKFENDTGSETFAKFHENGNCELYHVNSKKFETTSSGAQIFGNLNVGTDAGAIFLTNPDGFSPKLQENAGSLEFSTNNNKRMTLGSSGNLEFVDSSRITMGNSADFQLLHNGSNSFIVNSTGFLDLQADAFRILTTGSETQAKFTANGSVELYYDNGKKFETASYGAVTTGTFQATGNIEVFDNGKIIAGTHADLQFYHNNGNNFIYAATNSAILIGVGNTHRWTFDTNGHFKPAANDTFDIGTSSARVRNIYTNDLNLSNEGSANDVDGTWGSYTIQEGAEDLFLVNKRNGKKYKFNLTEVS